MPRNCAYYVAGIKICKVTPMLKMLFATISALLQFAQCVKYFFQVLISKSNNFMLVKRRKRPLEPRRIQNKSNIFLEFG